MSNEKQYYSTIEAAKLLGVSVRTIQLWVENGSLDAWKTAGGHRRIVASSIDKHIKQQNDVYDPIDKNDTKKILIVEDNPTVSIFYDAAIKSWGLPIKVTCVDNGFAGLVAIGKEKPDLLITDIYMPGMDGLQMIQSLFKSGLMSVEQIVVISGLPEQDIHERGGIPLGINFFSKPVDVEQLKSTIKSKFSIS